MATTITRDQLHDLVDHLPETSWPAVAELMAELANDPVLAALATAPLDDEPETAEEAAGVADAFAEIARGETIPDHEVRRQLFGQP